MRYLSRFASLARPGSGRRARWLVGICLGFVLLVWLVGVVWAGDGDNLPSAVSDLYPLGESSGDRYTYVWPYRHYWQPSGGTTSTSGVVGNAVRFADPGDYLTIPEDVAYERLWNRDAISAWVRMSSTSGSWWLVDTDFGGAPMNVQLYYDQGENDMVYRVFGYDESDPYNPVGVTSAVTSTTNLSADTWYFVVAYLDFFNNEIGISINAGTPVTATHTAGLSLSRNRALMGITGHDGDPGNVDVDELATWNRQLTSAEITWLYNGGSGRSYLELGLAPPSQPTATPQATPTPHDWPSQVLQDPEMNIDPGPDPPPGAGGPAVGSDLGYWKGRSHVGTALWGCSYNDWASDWDTGEYWGLAADACGPDGHEGYWWTAETIHAEGYIDQASDGFYQDVSWPSYNPMYLTYWVRVAQPGNSAELQVILEDLGSGYTVAYDWGTVTSSTWQRHTVYFPASPTCPVGPGCPGDYRLRFVLGELLAVDPDCPNGVNLPWNRAVMIDGVALSSTGYYVCPSSYNGPEPTMTPTQTPAATSTPDLTASPWPSSTPRPTGTNWPTMTSTPTPPPLATWTPAPTSSPWPTSTPLPMTRIYATPPGGWGTLPAPTLAAWPTLAPWPGFTPNATSEARVGAVGTVVADVVAWATSVYTTVNWAESMDYDPSLYFTTNLSVTGTMTQPVFTLGYVTRPISWFKGILRFMPNLASLLLPVFAAFLFMLAVDLIQPAYAILVWVVDKLERIWQALPFT